MVTGFDLIHDNGPLQKHWIRRIIAYILDLFISSLGVYIIFYFLISLNLRFAALWYFPMTAGMVQVFYSAVLEYSSRKTVGKAIMKLEVEQLTQEFDLSKALIRNFSKIHGIILLLDWLVGMASEGDPRQRYLDRVAETTVRAKGEPVHVRDYINDHLFRGETREEERDEEEKEEENRCHECGGELISIGEDRYRCRNCGRIQ